MTWQTEQRTIAEHETAKSRTMGIRKGKWIFICAMGEGEKKKSLLPDAGPGWGIIPTVTFKLHRQERWERADVPPQGPAQPSNSGSTSQLDHGLSHRGAWCPRGALLPSTDSALLGSPHPLHPATKFQEKTTDRTLTCKQFCPKINSGDQTFRYTQSTRNLKANSCIRDGKQVPPTQKAFWRKFQVEKGLWVWLFSAYPKQAPSTYWVYSSPITAENKNGKNQQHTSLK